MKLTIIKTHNPLFLAKALHLYFLDMSLSTALNHAKNLPYSFKLSLAEAEYAAKHFALYATVQKEKEEHEIEPAFYNSYNMNINPPASYIEAEAWFEALDEKEKNHVNQIVIWRQRPAVC